jgi:hypothetical protein
LDACSHNIAGASEIVPAEAEVMMQRPANRGRLGSLQEISQFERMRGGGRSHYRTCLSAEIPCQQGKEQGILLKPAYAAIFGAQLASKFRSLQPNSLSKRTGKDF